MAQLLAVMFLAAETARVCRWWAEHLGRQAQVVVQTGCLRLELDGVKIGLHSADDGWDPIGASPVVHWTSDDLETQRRPPTGAGYRPHRGRLVVSRAVGCDGSSTRSATSSAWTAPDPSDRDGLRAFS
ncbi:MAG TPA: hypothetical protein VFS29_06110 [Motilibacteraceae bacterium]|nr:hypothetical protein [Motilibacteraceae bacterium]